MATLQAWYDAQIVPRVINVCCGLSAHHHLRRRACAGLHGRVVEIGFGSGHNVPFYPPAVTAVDAVEPADLGWRLGQRRLADATVPVQRAGLDGQRLPFADDAYDTALSSFSLCTIPDPGAALAEVRRVLKPGGALHFVEHGRAPDADVRRWQRRLEPVQKRVAGGCHLTRDIRGLLSGAGFEIVELEEFYEPRAPKVLAALTLGVALSP